MKEKTCLNTILAAGQQAVWKKCIFCEISVFENPTIVNLHFVSKNVSMMISQISTILALFAKIVNFSKAISLCNTFFLPVEFVSM